MARIDEIDIPHLEFAEASAPGTPASGIVRIYAKTDGLLYQKDDAGVETALANAASGSVATDAIWDAAGDLAVGTGANTAAKLAAGSEGDVLTIASGVPSWETPAGASGFDAYGPTAEYRIDRPPASPEAENDEFDDGSVSGSWSAWTGATDPATTDETTFPGKLFIVASTSVSAPSHMEQAYAPSSGVAFVIGCKMQFAMDTYASHSFQFGISINSASGTTIHHVVLLDDGASTTSFHRIYDSVANATRNIAGLAYGAPIYLAIGRDTGNLYTTWFSVDGNLWTRLGVSGAVGTAITHISIFVRTNATGTDRRVLIDWFRRLASAPSGTMKFGS